MTQISDEELCSDLEQLRALIADAKKVLHDHTTSLRESTMELRHALRDAGDSKARASQVNQQIGGLLDGAGSKLREIGQDLPRLAEVARPLQAEMAGLEKLTQEVETLASQTLLNALNTAASAERAGVQGAVLSVVAREISLLPEQARAASEEVRHAILAADTGLRDLADRLGRAAELGDRAVSYAEVEVQQLRDRIRAYGDEIAATLRNASKLESLTGAATLRSKRAVAAFDDIVVAVTKVLTDTRARIAL